MHEIKTLIDIQSKAFADFKESNDIRLMALEDRRGANVLAEEAGMEAHKRVKAVEGVVSDVQTTIKKIEEILGRPKGLLMSSESFNNHEQRKSFSKFLKKGIVDENFSTKAFATDPGGDGGYAVPEQLDAELQNYLYASSPMRQICSVVTSYSSDYKLAVNTGGMAAGWVGEKDARAETNTPNIEQVTPPIGELYANPAATQWMLDDAGFDIEAWLMREIEGKFAAMEGDAFINGTGTKQPKGFLAYTSSADADSARTFGVLKHMVTASATAITHDV